LPSSIRAHLHTIPWRESYSVDNCDADCLS
jgi:hypothetical protein